MSELRKLVTKLKEVYGTSPSFEVGKDLFEGVVRAIVSQNTNDKLTEKACNKFFSKYKGFDDLIRADIEEIKKEIKVAGLSNIKAKRLKEVAYFSKEIEHALNLPLYLAREKLLRIPGIGDKTADVLLLFFAKKKAFPVDTHIFRITKRIGFVHEDASYMDVSEFYRKHIRSVEELQVLHINLRKMGKDICKARSPNCGGCFVRDICKFSRNLSSSIK